MEKQTGLELVFLCGLIFFFAAFIFNALWNFESTRIELFIFITFGITLCLLGHNDTQIDRIIKFFEIGKK